MKHSCAGTRRNRRSRFFLALYISAILMMLPPGRGLAAGAIGQLPSRGDDESPHRRSTAPSSAAVLHIEDPARTTRVDYSQPTAHLAGRATELASPLLWTNKTTGDHGTFTPDERWIIDGLPLAPGDNVFRVSATTTTRSPNDGAYDAATNYLYSITDAWLDGQNEGVGWGSGWLLQATGAAGHILGHATATNLSISPQAWGLWASTGKSRAFRSFAHPLQPGETLSLHVQNNHVQPGGSIGFGLRNGFGQTLFAFRFAGGEAHYQVDDATENGRGTGIPWTPDGLDIAFELTSPSTYRLQVNGHEFTGQLSAETEIHLRQLFLWNDRGGSGPGHNFFLAALSILGEPVEAREISSTRSIHRHYGPHFRARPAGRTADLHIEFPLAESSRIYELYYSTNLHAHTAWEPFGLNWRGSNAPMLVELENLPGVLYLRATSKKVAAWDIDNPYRYVDWDTYGQYKANFHAHTSMSDGTSTPGEVIDHYAQLGYSILSLTDHDTMGPVISERERTTWPWEAYGRFPEALGMVAIQGNELSRRHHTGAYFVEYGNLNMDEEETGFEAIGQLGGIGVIFHPGKNHFLHDRPLEWYADMFRAYPHLVGMEIYNMNNRYPQDQPRWDALLTEIIRERPVWGFANDDMHHVDLQLGFSWNVMILPELTEYWVRDAMEHGVFFFAHSPHAHDGPPPPIIEAIHVDTFEGIITLQASGHERTDWISEGLVVHVGDSIPLAEIPHPGVYVRALLHAADSDAVLGTQPFHIRGVTGAP